METSGKRARENWLVDTKVAGARETICIFQSRTQSVVGGRR